MVCVDRGDGFVTLRIEWLTGRIEALDPEAAQPIEETAPHQLDAGEQRIGRSALSPGRDRAIEIVQHREKRDDQVAPRSRDLLAGVALETRARLVHLEVRLVLARERLAQAPIAIGQLRLERRQLNGRRPLL